MVSARILLAGLALLIPLIRAVPQSTSAASVTSAHKTTSSTKHSTKSTKTSTKTSSTSTASTPLCTPEAQGIVQPTAGATIVQTNDGNYGPTYLEVIYCSGAYFEISSVDGSVWLTETDSLNSGELLIKNQAPDNKDSFAGFYSYRFNASIYPSDGDYLTGERTLSVYETTTGYYNPMNFEISSINVSFTVTDSS